MQIAGGCALGIDVVIHPLNLLRGDPDGLRNSFTRDTVVFTVKAQVHLVVGQGEEKFILALCQRIGVGGRRPLNNVLRKPQVRQADRPAFCKGGQWASRRRPRRPV
jgi:hypothetical protein